MGQVSQPHYVSVPLRLSGRRWLAFADLPHTSPEQLFPAEIWRQGFVVRGCAQEFSTFFTRTYGGQSLLTGREAVLELCSERHFERSKIRRLIRQGLRWGEVLAVESPDRPLRDAISAFYQTVRLRYPALLRWLYRDNWQQAEQLFVFRGYDNQILALLTLSGRGPRRWHTELLLRAPQAPAGVMEALLAQVHASLSERGPGEWSLGEVPFFLLEAPCNFKENLLLQLGRLLQPVYSAQGLLRFKAKFHPTWRAVGLYGYPDLSWPVLWDIFWASRCAELYWRRWCPFSTKLLHRAGARHQDSG